MRPLGTYRAAPALPERLKPLATLARDLRWIWRPELRGLFEILDAAAWERTGNPIEVLRTVDPERLATLAEDSQFVEHVASEEARLAEEDRSAPRVPEAAALAERGDTVAYFSAEFGLSEILPIYSGGLGVLAGDHLKSSSDLAVPLVGVGLFYREGFFRQLLTGDGRQKESYPIVEPQDLPLDLLEPPSGVPPIVTVRIAGGEVRLLVRRARVGRVTLLLLDSHLPVNRPADREITSRLYAGDIENRIKQEVVLGIGGLRALDLAGRRPAVRHANEGHATFLGLEKIRQLRAENGLSFAQAREIAVAGNVFTTHTPVPAGIDLFPPELMKRHFADEVESYGLTFEEFLGLGRQVPEDPNESFSMAVLGLRLSGHVNGVSKLHASVSRRLWRGVFQEDPLSEVPIEAITNGVHPPTWTAPSIAALSPAAAPEAVDRGELWRRHEALREQLVTAVRARTAAARQRRGAPDGDVQSAFSLLDARALTISFARRFATYKRATLIFYNLQRLARLLNDADRPVQLVFAGKAHPKDQAGKEFLARVGEYSQRAELRGRVVLLEDYDMRLTRLLVAGSDVWLNTPRRPYEASGTSGMKAAMNGVLSLSVLDGWWDEAPREETGFTVGDGADGRSDEEVSTALYERLENDVVPMFYDRGGDPGAWPRAWVERMVKAASVLGRMFSTDRMLGDYLRQMYLPASDRTRMLSADGFAKARELAEWKARIAKAWEGVQFVSVDLSVSDPARLEPGETFLADIEVRLGELEPEEVEVDWFEGAIDPDGVVDAGFTTSLALVERVDGAARYRGTITRPADNSRGYSVRLRPRHPLLLRLNETGFVLWAG